MNPSTSRSWPHAFNEHTLIAQPGEINDFANFLDLNFPNFESLENGQPGLDTPTGDLGMDQLGMDGTINEPSATLRTHAATAQPGSTLPVYEHAKNAGPLCTPFHPNMLHQHHEHMISSQIYQPRMMIPPTPRSLEMNGATIAYYQQLDPHSHLLYDRNQVGMFEAARC